MDLEIADTESYNLFHSFVRQQMHKSATQPMHALLNNISSGINQDGEFI